MKRLPRYNCIDIDDEFWPQSSPEQYKVLDQKPITDEIIGTIYWLIDEKIAVKPGRPLFGFVILDCEAVVYLDISDALLEAHCAKRGDTALTDALFIKKAWRRTGTGTRRRTKRCFTT